MKGTRTQINHRSLAFIVLISGIVGGLLIVFSILLLCKYCLNRRNLREAEQLKLLYETLNQASLLDPNRFYSRGIQKSSPLEPRRSNPLDRYFLQDDQWQIPSSKQVPSDYHLSSGQSTHHQSYHNSREHIGNKQQELHSYGNIANDEEQAYLQVDPRCYVRQNSNASLVAHRKSDAPRLEKGRSLNVDTRPSPLSTSLSPYRQSSFDVALAYHSQQQSSTPTSLASTQPDIYYTPRGSSLSVLGNPLSNTPTGSQHLSPPTPSTSRKNSIALIIDKKDRTATTTTLDTFGTQTSPVRSSIAQREHEHSRSLEYSLPPVVPQYTSSNCTTNDKQSRSFDAVHLLRPGVNRSDVVNRRTKSYEYADDRRPSTSSIAPAPIIIKIPDMSELVQQAAQLSQLQNRRLSTNMEDYQNNTGRKETLVQQMNSNDPDEDARTASQDLWRLRQSYELEEQQQLDRTSPEELSPDLLTSTSIDSAGAMPIHNINNHNPIINNDNNSLKYQHRRKSSSNLLLPPPEVRRQALRRTFEKRRSCINQSNARREQQLLNNQIGLDDENLRHPLTSFSSLLNNFNSKSENSSFERSLETDFDMQSDTSSRGPNDQFTSIESSGNENAVPDVTNRYINNNRRQPSPHISPHQDDSGYKSLESQNSQNRTFSLDWMSADGAESVIYMGESRKQQRSVDVKDLEDDLAQQEQDQQKLLNYNRRSPKLLHTGLHHSYQETSTNLIPPSLSNSNMMQQRSLSTNIPLVDHYKPSPINLSVLSNTNQTNNNTNKLSTSSSFTRTASKKRREFGKDKRHAASNVGLPYLIADEQQATIHQIDETNTKPLISSLHVRYADLRRTKSDGSRNSSRNHQDSFIKESPPCPNKNKYDTRLSSSTDGIPVSLSPLSPMRQHLSPDRTDSENSHHTLQPSSFSATPPFILSPQVETFHSQRGSISSDNQQSLTSSSPTAKTKTAAIHSIIPTYISKPRLKFSMVRDTAMTGLGHSLPVYSMPITRDYSIDEKTNRIVNEFLMHDPTLEGRKTINDDISYRGTPKRHHHRIRLKTFDESTMMTSTVNNTQKQSQQQQQPRSPVNKQRHHGPLQTNNVRKHPQYHYPPVRLPDNLEQEEGDSSDPASPTVILTQQQSINTTRRDNSMTVGSPSIIITGDDSGS
ncbi:unnamed protein product [Adineta steineri]|uniref:Uncharacterized protein n=1 Tax=Adineta steineri TaxID=433720 RepID=A0A814NZM1_9BILA|nr:unnamed protein product [Adineta steineri]